MNSFIGVDPATLTTWLSTAQVALYELSTGKQVVSVAMGDLRVSYSAATVSDLNKVIADLQTAITAATLQGQRRKGVYIRGGKGL
ncbi:MAG: gpW family head-tail joining protein [Candidatus Competibacter denitrificans]